MLDDLAARKARLMEGWQHPGYPWTIRTIADHLAAGYGLRVDCRACGHWAMLDLVGLGERYGRDAELERFTRNLVCSVQDCTAKNPGITVICEGAHKSIWAE